LPILSSNKKNEPQMVWSPSYFRNTNVKKTYINKALYFCDCEFISRFSNHQKNIDKAFFDFAA